MSSSERSKEGSGEFPPEEIFPTLKLEELRELAEAVTEAGAYQSAIMRELGGRSSSFASLRAIFEGF